GGGGGGRSGRGAGGGGGKIGRERGDCSGDGGDAASGGGNAPQSGLARCGKDRISFFRASCAREDCGSDAGGRVKGDTRFSRQSCRRRASDHPPAKAGGSLLTKTSSASTSSTRSGAWQHNFVGFEHARRELTGWICWFNEARPHQALGYRSPREFRAHEATQVA